LDPVTAALVGWLVNRIAAAGERMLARWLGRDKQANALRAVVSEAIRAAVNEITDPGDREAIAQALRRDDSGTPETGIGDLLALEDAVRHLVLPRLAVLAEQVHRADADHLIDAIAQNVMRGIQLNAARGGPLAPVADLLHHEQLAVIGGRIAGASERGADAGEEMARELKEMRRLLGSALPHSWSALVPSRPVRLAPRPAVLAGREQLLAHVHERLAGSGSGWPRVVALHGLGGAGKTSMALEYAHLHAEEYGVTWQFAAEDQATLAAGFAELARQLAGHDAFGADHVAQVHSSLAARQDAWLLLFDNAASHAALRPVLPPAGHGHVIVTSQDPHWPAGQAVEVPVLDQHVAAEFLLNRTGTADMGAARDLARQLGGLPLALEQAAAYMAVTGLSLAGYAGRFREQRATLLARGEPLGYERTVATTWSMAFRQLEQSAPPAVGLLRLVSCCAPEAVPLSLLLQPRPGLAGQLGAEVTSTLVPLLEDPLAAEDAVAALRRYSLVTPAGDGLVSVHRLVQAVTADQMPAELADQWRHAAAVLIDAAIPADPGSPETWPTCAALLPHTQAALTADSDGMGRIANYLGYSGSYLAARDLYKEVTEARMRIFGPEHANTLTSRNDLAYWTGLAGDAVKARDQFAALLPVRERVSGPEHPDTLTTSANLAQWTGVAGDAAGARDQFAALLPVRERVSGPEHPATLTVRAALARWTGTAGDAAGARDQSAALLPIRQRILGLTHPATLHTQYNLAYWAGAAGDAAGARDQLAALLPIRERILGPEHPDVLTTRTDLAYWTGAAGDAAGARDQLAALLPIRERILGPEHPDVLTTRTDLAYWTRQTGSGPRAT
jgi:hypothetical protein